jgi:ribulose-phosphate 3-epimerase
MLMYPEHFVESFAQSGADLISIHVESKSPIEKTLHLIKQMGKQVGLAINPETPIEAVFPFLDFVDLVLIMSVNPGFCGQKFIESSLEKIEILRKHYPSINIEVDGGINLEYARRCVQSGANIVVTGSSFFAAADAREFVQKIEHE